MAQPSRVPRRNPSTFYVALFSFLLFLQPGILTALRNIHTTRVNETGFPFTSTFVTVLPDGATEPADTAPSSVLNIALISPGDTSRLFSHYHVMPAVTMAAEWAVSRGLIQATQVRIRGRDSGCNAQNGPMAAIDFHAHRQVDVFLGPVCDYSLAPVARFASVWSNPVITPGGFAHDLGHKTPPHGEFPLLTRIGANFNSMSAGLLTTVRSHFGWRRVKVIYDGLARSDVVPRFCFLAAAALVNASKKSNIPFAFHIYVPQVDSVEDMLVEEVGNDFSIVILCASPDSVREVMIKAHELNFDNGEYVFLNIDLFSSKNESETPWHRANDTAARNRKARKAYEALMTVTLRMPTSEDYRTFSNEVKSRAATMFPNFTYGEDEVNSFVGAFHDAVLLYAIALNETLAQNGSITDGKAITRRMWNRTFNGITGNVSIDSNGDRNADYSLLDLNPNTDRFEVVANYFGTKRKYEPVPGKSIHWAGGRTGPPPDSPTCGFDGSKCPPDV